MLHRQEFYVGNFTEEGERKIRSAKLYLPHDSFTFKRVLIIAGASVFQS